MLRTRAYIGQHMPLYCSAMGKIYMAFGHQDYVASYWESHQEQIQPLTRNTITELSAMYDELVFDIHGRVPYAISKELGFNVREA